MFLRNPGLLCCFEGFEDSAQALGFVQVQQRKTIRTTQTFKGALDAVAQQAMRNSVDSTL